MVTHSFVLQRPRLSLLTFHLVSSLRLPCWFSLQTRRSDFRQKREKKRGDTKRPETAFQIEMMVGRISCGATTLSIMTFSIMTFSIMTLSIKVLSVTLSITMLFIMLSVIMLSVAFYLLLCWVSLCWMLLCWEFLKVSTFRISLNMCVCVHDCLFLSN